MKEAFLISSGKSWGLQHTFRASLYKVLSHGLWKDIYLMEDSQFHSAAINRNESSSGEIRLALRTYLASFESRWLKGIPILPNEGESCSEVVPLQENGSCLSTIDLRITDFEFLEAKILQKWLCAE